MQLPRDAKAGMIGDLNRIIAHVEADEPVEAIMLLLRLAAAGVAGMALNPSMSLPGALEWFGGMVETSYASMNTPAGRAFVKSQGRIKLVPEGGDQ